MLLLQMGKLRHTGDLAKSRNTSSNWHHPPGTAESPGSRGLLGCTTRLQRMPARCHPFPGAPAEPSQPPTAQIPAAI